RFRRAPDGAPREGSSPQQAVQVGGRQSEPRIVRRLVAQADAIDKQHDDRHSVSLYPRRLSIYFTTVCAGVEEYRSIYYHNIQRHQRGGFAMRLFSEMNREELRREIERLEEEMRRARRNGFVSELE